MTQKETNKNLLETLPSRPGALRLIPLGGLGEFGMNCMLLECDGEMMMIDAGQMMPDADMPGIDSVIPDIRFVREHARRLRGIWITHAHEDHIGALPYLLPMLPPEIPLWGSEFTIELMREKFEEFRLKPNYQIYEARRKYRLGQSFECEPIAVTHSIVESFAVAVRTPAGVIIHSGDYKIDPSPPDGVAFDHYAFSRYAEEEEDGVLMLLTDSTNADRRGSSPSESEVYPRLSQLIRDAEGMVVVSCFASSIHRIQTLLNIAAEAGRTVYPAGLNMERNIRVARRLDLIEVPGSYAEDTRGIDSLPRHRRLVLTTGSQGEPLSALSRIALGTHKHVRVEPGDTAILSARMIPGNEKAIYTLLNNLSRKGVKVHDERSTPGIHVSGHGYRDEIKTLINLTNPRYLLPVHGEHRQMQAVRALGLELGLREDEILFLETGDVLEYAGDRPRLLGKVPHGRVLVDGKGIGDVGEAVLRDRRYLAEDGMVVVTIAIDRETGEILNGPDIVSRGFVHEEDPASAVVLAEARRLVVDVVAAEAPSMREDRSTMQQTLKKELRGFFRRETERFPIIVPVVLEV